MMKQLTLSGIHEAFKDNPSAQTAINSNIRQLNRMKKYVERLHFEYGYQKDGWFFRLLIEHNPDYKWGIKHLKRLSTIKNFARMPQDGRSVTEAMISMAKNRHFSDIYTFEKVRVKRCGFTSICPIHPEKNPSFSVFTGKDGCQRFTCFSCGAKGSIIDFVMQVNKLSFLDSVRWLNSSNS